VASKSAGGNRDRVPRTKSTGCELDEGVAQTDAVFFDAAGNLVGADARPGEASAASGWYRPSGGRKVRQMVRRAWGLVAVVAGLASVAGIATSPVAATAGGTLNTNASLTLVSNVGRCQSFPSATNCDARTDDGPFPELGNVTASFTFPMDWGSGLCPSGFGKALAYPMSLEVASKGAINVDVSAATTCVVVESTGTQTQTFTVTGGTGIYAGASGSGTLTRALAGVAPDGARHGYEMWQGTLTVPGLVFDLTPPTFAGATPRKVVAPRHAKRVRVKYVVTATDDADGPVPVTCKPRSGSRFHIGRTRVHCFAADTSANLATASFRITVRRHR
jgi:HYR domain